MTNGTASSPAPSARPGGVALLVSSDTTVVSALSNSAAKLGITLELCAEPSNATRLLNHGQFEAVIVDLDLGEPGHSVLEQVRSSRSNKTAVTFVITPGAEGKAPTGSNFVLQRPLSAEAVDRTFRAAYGMIVRELRRYFRSPMTVPAVLSRPNTADVQCQTFDISEGGMGIVTEAALEPGLQLGIQFSLPGDQAPIHSTAEVCWSGFQGRVGLRFLEFPSKQKFQLQIWLSSKLEKSLPDGVVERFRTSSS